MFKCSPSEGFIGHQFLFVTQNLELSLLSFSAFALSDVFIMVKTKQTAKKSTGIEVPHILIKLIPKHQATAATALQHEQPVEPNS